MDGAAAGALSEQRRSQRVAAKLWHVPLYPGECHGLVLEAEVPGDYVVLGGQEASTEKKNGFAVASKTLTINTHQCYIRKILLNNKGIICILSY